MLSTIPIYMILAGVSLMELEYRGYSTPMDPLETYGLSFLIGVLVFAYVEHAVAAWAKAQCYLQVWRQEAAQPPASALMEEGEK